MKDPLETLAEEQLYALAADLALQLEKGAGLKPVLYLLSKARKRAASAVYALSKVDPFDTNAIFKLQNDLNLYDELVADCRTLVIEGRQANQLLGERDRVELSDLIMSEEDRRALGIEPLGTDL